MDKEQLFSKFIQMLNHRAEYTNSKMDGGISSDYGFGYLQSLVYHMVLDVPGAAEYLKTHIGQLSKLNQIEGIVSETPVENI